MRSTTNFGSARHFGTADRRKPAVLRALTGDDRPALNKPGYRKGDDMNYLYPDDLEIEEEPMPSPLYRKYGRTYINTSNPPPTL